MKIIYEPKGAAREYAPLALNIFRGCVHGCRYCYAPGATRKKAERFFRDASMKQEVLSRVEHDAKLLAGTGDEREILISFIGDPYQEPERETQITRRVIEILIHHGLRFTVLTKAGWNAARDFDLMMNYGKCRMGVSLVWQDDEYRRLWEPGAASVSDRRITIMEAKDVGIPTWVSLEPVIDTEQALRVVRSIHSVVDHWAVGKINHLSLSRTPDWPGFRSDITALFERLGASYYIKKSLMEV